jgi:uncharacterized protein YutE (UPF0331/DUF86 family)
MAPEVLLRKLSYLRRLLDDLAPYEEATLEQVLADHYKLERIFELLVVVTADFLNHSLIERDLSPTSYRDSYRMAAEQGLLPADLAERLQDAASIRSVIVHVYEWVDYVMLHDSLKPALHDFRQAVALFETQVGDEA